MNNSGHSLKIEEINDSETLLQERAVVGGLPSRADTTRRTGHSVRCNSMDGSQVSSDTRSRGPEDRRQLGQRGESLVRGHRRPESAERAFLAIGFDHHVRAVPEPLREVGDELRVGLRAGLAVAESLRPRVVGGRSQVVAAVSNPSR